ncbi:MAG TPA: hypothetical protein VFY07_02145, partial [Geomobilimonas sp.]|nr:hypothetical protein [Geomobilimonas sp.]
VFSYRVGHLLFLLTFAEASIFRQIKAAKGLRGDVAALRRTSDPEDLRRYREKGPFSQEVTSA